MATPPDSGGGGWPPPQPNNNNNSHLNRKRKQEGEESDLQQAAARPRMTPLGNPGPTAPIAPTGAAPVRPGRRRGFIIREEDADGNVIREGPAPPPKPESVQRLAAHRRERWARQEQEGGMEVEMGGPRPTLPRQPQPPLPMQQPMAAPPRPRPAPLPVLPPPVPPASTGWPVPVSPYPTTTEAAAAAVAGGGGGEVEEGFFAEWPGLMGTTGDEYERGRRIEVCVGGGVDVDYMEGTRLEANDQHINPNHKPALPHTHPQQKHTHAHKHTQQM